MSTQQLQNLLVAYTATATGKDALNLGAALARTTGAHLHIVTVIPEDNAYAVSTPQTGGMYPSSANSCAAGYRTRRLRYPTTSAAVSIPSVTLLMPPAYWRLQNN